MTEYSWLCVRGFRYTGEGQPKRLDGVEFNEIEANQLYFILWDRYIVQRVCCKLVNTFGCFYLGFKDFYDWVY